VFKTFIHIGSDYGLELSDLLEWNVALLQYFGPYRLFAKPILNSNAFLEQKDYVERYRPPEVITSILVIP
jgi:hypothetical protein